jgi:hypothetical protein
MTTMRTGDGHTAIARSRSADDQPVANSNTRNVAASAV